jgi:tetratricopeptide (TPR) repeat protein
LIKKALNFILLSIIFSLLINAGNDTNLSDSTVIDAITAASEKTTIEDTTIKKSNTDDLQKDNNNAVKTENNPESVVIDDTEFDTESKATQVIDVFDLDKTKKEYVKEEEQKPKKEDDSTIVIKEDKSKNPVQEKDTSMIIFADNYDPYYSNHKEENNQVVTKNKKTIDIPTTIEEFCKANPQFIYDSNNIITPGNKSISPKLGEDIINIAYKEFKQNNINIARSYFEKLLYYNYRISDSYYYLSWCYYIDKDYFTAINYMKGALDYCEKENQPINVITDYLIQVGNMYYKLEDYANSIIYFNRALENDPSIVDIYNKLAVSYYKKGDKTNASEIWKKGTELGDINCKKNYEWFLKQK